MRQQVEAVMLQHPEGPPTLRQHHSEHLGWHPQQLTPGSGSAMGAQLCSNNPSPQLESKQHSRVKQSPPAQTPTGANPEG